MKKKKELFKKSLIICAFIYVAITLFNQQKALSTYNQDTADLQAKLDQETAYKQQLEDKKNSVNSLEFIEQMAREKLDMYLPNEKVFVDKGM